MKNLLLYAFEISVMLITINFICDNYATSFVCLIFAIILAFLIDSKFD